MRIEKTVWIINHYASTPAAGMGGRHYYLAQELVRLGFKVYLISASYTHLLRAPPALEKNHMLEIVDGIHYIWLRGLRYEHAHSKKRILNWFIFAWRLCGLRKIIKDDPVAILCSSPSLISFLGAKYLAWRLRARLIFEVRDIWPLTFVKLGGYSIRHPFIRFLQWIEDAAYRHSERVISNLPMAVEHMVQRGMDRAKFAWIPNGFSLGEVKNPQELSSTTARRLPADKFLVGYAGTLGVANAMEVLLQAADELKDVPGISIVLVGAGRECSRLKKFAIDRGLQNVIFMDAIPKNQIQNLLARFDVLYIGWKKDPLYDFGIAPNKLPEYMYSGKPILHSFSGAGDVVEKFKMGLTVPAEDSRAVAQAILKLYQMPSIDREKLGANGRRYVLENHEYSMLAAKLADVICKA
jgi:glycosyltransferase involved in cell wall biosynthesis